MDHRLVRWTRRPTENGDNPDSKREVFAMNGVICILLLLLAGVSSATDQEVAPYLDVRVNFTRQMVMGDIGDVRQQAGNDGSDRFIYTPHGRGPHEWDYKYVAGGLNSEPARFAGVMYVNCVVGSRPGTTNQDGMDMRPWRRKIEWEARVVSGAATIKVVIGGITWAWKNDTHEPYTLPFGDTLRSRDLGSYELKPNWQRFEFDLAGASLKDEELRRVIGGFGWVMPAPPNGMAAFVYALGALRP